jgi:hypothetical protein
MSSMRHREHTYRPNQERCSDPTSAVMLDVPALQKAVREKNGGAVSMEFKYSLTKEDYDRFTAMKWHHVYMGRPWLMSRWRVWLVSHVPLTAMGILLLILRAMDIVGQGAFWIAFAGYIWRDGITTLWRNFLYKEYERKITFAPDNLAFKEVEVQFDDGGFETKMEGYSGRWDWRLVKNFVRDRDMDLLWLDQREALLVPARVFESDEVRQQFANFVKAHLTTNPVA